MVPRLFDWQADGRIIYKNGIVSSNILLELFYIIFY